MLFCFRFHVLPPSPPDPFLRKGIKGVVMVIGTKIIMIVEREIHVKEVEGERKISAMERGEAREDLVMKCHLWLSAFNF